MNNLKNTVVAGAPLTAASKVLIMIHGRGAGANDILGLSSHLDVDGFTLIAPQASNNSWYPLSFLAAPKDNEPYLTTSLQVLKGIVNDLEEQGVVKEHIYFLGFSQGACLAAEYTARNAAQYGGIVLFTGGLIGDRLYTENYSGAFDNTPVFIGTSNPDFHVPVERVHETTALFTTMKADVTLKVYENMGHTISQDEIILANQLVFNK